MLAFMIQKLIILNNKVDTKFYLSSTSTKYDKVGTVNISEDVLLFINILDFKGLNDYRPVPYKEYSRYIRFEQVQ